jgi:hypothetical protein
MGSLSTRLTILPGTETWSKTDHKTYVEVICACGTKKTIRKHNVVHLLVRSCGCLKGSPRLREVVYKGQKTTLVIACKKTGFYPSSIQNKARLSGISLQESFDYFVANVKA